MIQVIVWGIIQGLTEFLPISSSGHLILIPALFTEWGWEIAEPSQATQAFLHLGTLGAVLIYFRTEMRSVLSFRTNPEGRHLLTLLAWGTLPAVVLGGILWGVEISSPIVVSVLLIINGGVLLVLSRLHFQAWGVIEQLEAKDGLVVGGWQVLGFLPGISRSGMTIAGGCWRGLSTTEAIRFSFLLAIPTIFGAGLVSLIELVGEDHPVGWAELAVGLMVSLVTGYLAIVGLIRAIDRIGFLPFGLYCLIGGGLALVVLA